MKMMLQISGFLLVLFVSAIHSSCDPKWTLTCDDGTCITMSRRCNNRRDCMNREDEANCGIGGTSCLERSYFESRYSGYRCSKKCRTNKDCLIGESCLCDDECGLSCINERARCRDLPAHVKNSQGYDIIRFENDKRIQMKNSTEFMVGDMILYKCEKGFRITGPFPRCASDGKWTKVKPQCVDFSKCGQAGQVRLKKILPVNKIVSGDESTETAWPWYAMITKKKWNAYMTFNKCSLLGGGSLINNKWVLTAAHVVSYFSTDTDSNWFKEVLVSLGVHEKPKNNVISSAVKVFAPDVILIHEGFNEWTYERDIALIKLGNRIETKTMEEIPNTNTGVEFDYYIRPVCIPCSGSCFSAKVRRKKSKRYNLRRAIKMCKREERKLLKNKGKVVVMGFGNTKQSSQSCINVAPSLQQGQLRVLSYAECRRAVANINSSDTYGISMVFNSNFICCVGKNTEKLVDACQGDSGCPVVRKISPKNLQKSCWTQIGIVSWGVGCGTGRPAFYTNVATFARWINNTIDGYETCLRPIESRSKITRGPIPIKNPRDGDVPRLNVDSASGRRCAVLRPELIPGLPPVRPRYKKRRRQRHK